MNDAARLAALGRRAGLKQPISWVAESASTNADVRAMAEAGAPHGTALFAHHQTAGRGRMGRAWQAPPGQNLTLSVVLRPRLSPADLPRLVLAAGVATAQICGGGCALKWPNDVLSADGRKVAGVLAGAEFEGSRLAYVIMGVGINVAWAPPELPAASLAELGVDADPVELAVAWVAAMLEQAARAETDPTGVLADYRHLDGTVGRRVQVADVSGVACGIDDDGALRVLLDDGTQHRILAGDVQMVG